MAHNSGTTITIPLYIDWTTSKQPDLDPVCFLQKYYEACMHLNGRYDLKKLPPFLLTRIITWFDFTKPAEKVYGNKDLV